MNNRDLLYQFVQSAEEQRKRRNFDAFMDGLESDLIKDLNEIYASGDMKRYHQYVHNVKKTTGFTILRNSNGEHKLQY